MNSMADNTVALVTGAGQGIGREIALRLSREGYFVVVADVQPRGGEETVAAIGGRNSLFVQCDVGDEVSVKNCFAMAMRDGRRLAVLVNNAGIIRDRLIWKMTVEEFDEVLRVNLRGTWLMSREAAAIMRGQQSGRIINISSRAWLGNPGQTNYSASKAGVVGMTRALALEMARYRVTVNAVAPGLIDTQLTRSLPDAARQKLLAAQPGGQMGTAQDVAETVAFLASDKAGFITGQVFHVDGGRSIGAAVN